MSCEATRDAIDRFLEGEDSLDPQREHLAACARCRAALAEAEQLAADLGAYFADVGSPARAEAVVARLRPRRRRLWLGLALAAAAALCVWLAWPRPAPEAPDGPLWTEVATPDLELEEPRPLTVPTAAQLGAPADLDGAEVIPVTALYPRATTLSGKIDAHLELANDARSWFQTDKPLYRPGETIWFRHWLVASRDFAPRRHVRPVELLAPNGSVVASGPVSEGHGFPLPHGIPGGTYTLRIAGDTVATRAKEILVSTYQPPAFKKSLDFLRDAWAAGEEVEALFEVERSTGEPLAGARVTISASVDGEEFHAAEATTDARGALLVRFTLPAALSRDARLALQVHADGFSEAWAEAIPVAIADTRVALFPEGGSLLLAQPNRVFVQATNPVGEPASFRATLLADGAPVAPVESFARGFASFPLKPAAGVAYSLRIDSPAGVAPVALPRARKSGANLRLEENQPGRLVVSTFCNEAHPGAYLVAMCRSQRLFTYRMDLVPGQNRLDVEVPSEVNGVTRLSLLRADGVALAERLLYRDFGPQLAVELVPQRSSFGPRDEVVLTVRTRDADGAPVAAELALAVVDDSVLRFANDKSGHLAARLLLESEVQGAVFEPDYYFDEAEEDAPLALDHLLNTQGWRSFAWRPVVEDEPDVFGRIGALLAAHDNDEAYRLLSAVQLSHPSYEERLRTLFPDMFDSEGRLALVYAGTALYEDGLASDLARGGLVSIEQLGRSPHALWTRVRTLEDGREGWVLANALVPVEAEGVWADKALKRDMFLAIDTGVVDAFRFEQPEGVELRFGVAMTESRRAFAREALILDASLEELGKDFAADRLGRFDEIAFRQQGFFAYEQVRVFPQVTYAAGERPSERSDFRETVQWLPALHTDEHGEAEVRFCLSDAITSFEVRAEGISVEGAVGSATCLLDSQLPFALRTQVPNAATAGDRIELPLTLRNTTDRPLSVQLRGSFGPGLRSLDATERVVELAAGEARTEYFPLEAVDADGLQQVSFEAEADGLRDAFSTSLRVFPRGFPAAGATSGVLEPGQEIGLQVGLPDNLVPGTLRCQAAFFPSPLSSIAEGLGDMLREPSGCFEQTTSNNYPNAVIIGYLQSQGIDSPQLYARAHGLLARGYDRLVSYECAENGYEWFGQGKGHEALTAYGLMQFRDMERVGSQVDAAMLERTAAWLKSRVNDKGGYVHNPRFLHTWSDDEAMADCYVTWGLAAAGTPALEEQLAWCRQVAAARSDDPYIVALVANALLEAGQPAERELGWLRSAQELDGSFVGATRSVVCSTGEVLAIETTSLALLAFAQAGERGPVEAAARWLAEQRGAYGGYGSTQATVLALKALTAYASLPSEGTGGGTVAIALGEAATPVGYAPEEPKPLRVEGLEEHLTAGENSLHLSLDSDRALPYTVSLRYRRVAPDSDPDAALRLEVGLAAEEVTMGGTVRLTAEVANVSGAGTSMALVRLGYPGGLGLPTEQLEALVDEGRIDFFETSEREIILYLTCLEKDERRQFAFDLPAVVPGSYTAEPSSAYLYYQNGSKQWSAPLRLAIRQP